MLDKQPQKILTTVPHGLQVHNRVALSHWRGEDGLSWKFTLHVGGGRAFQHGGGY